MFILFCCAQLYTVICNNLRIFQDYQCKRCAMLHNPGAKKSATITSFATLCASSVYQQVTWAHWWRPLTTMTMNPSNITESLDCCHIWDEYMRTSTHTYYIANLQCKQKQIKWYIWKLEKGSSCEWDDVVVRQIEKHQKISDQNGNYRSQPPRNHPGFCDDRSND